MLADGGDTGVMDGGAADIALMDDFLEPGKVVAGFADGAAARSLKPDLDAL